MVLQHTTSQLPKLVQWDQWIWHMNVATLNSLMQTMKFSDMEGIQAAMLIYLL